MHITPESLEEGKLKLLLENEEIVKIVDCLDNPICESAIKILGFQKTHPKNVFDLAAAFRMMDYWQVPMLEP